MEQSDVAEIEEGSLEGRININGLENEVLLQYREYRTRIGVKKSFRFDISEWKWCCGLCKFSSWCAELNEQKEESCETLPIVLVILVFTIATISLVIS